MTLDDEQFDELTHAIRTISCAITPGAAPGKGIDGGHIASLTEAVMDVATGLKMIALALERGSRDDIDGDNVVSALSQIAAALDRIPVDGEDRT